MSILSNIATPLSFFLSNLGSVAVASDPVAPKDFEPAPMSRVIFWDEDKKEYRFGTYVALFNDLRGLRSELDTRVGEHFEASPYHPECQVDNMVIRARVIDEATEWGTYVNIADIYPPSATNIERAFELNMVA